MSGPYLGDWVEDSTHHFLWNSNGADGASITRATNGTVSVYKANSTTQSVAGITDTEDFDGLTGVHLVTIDTSADAFYAIANDYAVVVSGAVIDGKTVNAVIGHFSIENRFQEADVVKHLGTACPAPTTAGVPGVEVIVIGGTTLGAKAGGNLNVFFHNGNAVSTAVVASLDAAISGRAVAGDAMTLTGDYDPAKTAAQAGDAMTLTGAYDAAKAAASASALAAAAAVLNALATIGTHYATMITVNGQVWEFTAGAVHLAPSAGPTSLPTVGQ